MISSGTIVRFALAAYLCFPSGSPTTVPWDKPPEQWDLAETFRVLRDSPWSPAGIKLVAAWTQRHTDPQSGIVSSSPVNPENTNLVRGVEVSRSKPLPAFSVLWWSSKTVRLAVLRQRQLRHPAGAATVLAVEDLPDFVLAVEGSEPLRIFQDAREDLHDTAFLELEDGLTLDLKSVTFFEGTVDEDARTEFHFPRQTNGKPSLDPDSERVIFHCKASAKTARLGRENAIGVRAEFQPRTMHARGVPDL
jgi:hypothetical protein